MESEELTDVECQRLIGHNVMGKWHIDRLVGVGGMAAVYSATHRNGRVAALKILHKRYSSTREVVDRFLREAYIANKINHPGVVRIDDDGMTIEGQPLLVMELLDGLSLEKIQADHGGRLPVPDVMGIIEKLLDVMEVAHDAGIVHRDLKPENLLLTAKGELKVLDFGIARLLEGAEGVSRTRTGLVMGTPAFMAPEQALGRWNQVDARTDLWAIGAIAFNLISGAWVHDAPSANEMLVASASRPAPSLARFSNAPMSVVRCVDRALAFDQAKRFPDAATMHGEVMRVLIELGGSSSALLSASPAPLVSERRGSDGPVQSPQSEAATIGAPTPPPAAAPSVQPAPARRALGDQLDEDFPGLGDPALAGEAFRQLEKALFARQQYGPEHPECSRQLERAFAACESALEHSDEALIWQITPYAFTLNGKLVWEPRAPFDRIPYRLFADGLRVLGFVRGIDRRELGELIRLIALDRVRECAADDDYVTLLWDANLEHVVHQAIDAYSDGEQATREEFERSAADIAALAEFDTSFQLEECWLDSHRSPTGESAERREARLIRLLAMPETRDREALARAESFRPGELEPALDARSALEVDPATLAVARARFQDASGVEARLSRVVAEAYRAARALGTSGAVAVPLRAALDTLAASSPPNLAAFVSSVLAAFEDRDAPGEARELRAAWASEAIGERAAHVLLERAGQPGADPAFGSALGQVLAVCGSALVAPALEVLLQRPPAALADAIERYLSDNGAGHEQLLGQQFAKADLDLGLRLVRILVASRSPAAKEAMLRAAESPHPVVRIEALSHLDGSSDRVRLELRTLIEDPEPEVRIGALRAIGAGVIRAAGPYLVMRIKAPGFDKLPLEERRQALLALAALAPSRAESLCLELLQDSRVVTLDSHEETRALAADILADIAESAEAIEALAVASKARWRYSERVRISAGRAKEAAEARLSAPPGARASSGVPSGRQSGASALVRSDPVELGKRRKS